MMRIKGLHHSAYRCRDSEETRKFFEDFLGLPLVNAFEIGVTTLIFSHGLQRERRPGSSAGASPTTG